MMEMEIGPRYSVYCLYNVGYCVRFSGAWLNTEILAVKTKPEFGVILGADPFLATLTFSSMLTMSL